MEHRPSERNFNSEGHTTTIIDNDTDLTALPFVVITADKDTKETEYHGCKSASEVLDFVIDGNFNLDGTEALEFFQG